MDQKKLNGTVIVTYQSNFRYSQSYVKTEKKE